MTLRAILPNILPAILTLYYTRRFIDSDREILYMSSMYICKDLTRRFLLFRFLPGLSSVVVENFQKKWTTLAQIISAKKNTKTRKLDLGWACKTLVQNGLPLETAWIF